LKPSRNAFRHGLSVSLRIEMETLAKAEATARVLTNYGAPDGLII
jgi:hypothetical protein